MSRRATNNKIQGSTARAPLGGRRRGAARRTSGAAGFGGPLGSARDRRRVRDRNAAERMRVERALAEVPFDGIGGLDSRATGLGRTAHAASWAPPAAPAEGGAACPVCRSSQLVRDEVLMAGNLFHLVECLHCDHRFTSAPGTSGAHGRASVSAPGAAPPQGGRGDPGAGGLREIVDAVAMG